MGLEGDPMNKEVTTDPKNPDLVMGVAEPSSVEKTPEQVEEDVFDDFLMSVDGEDDDGELEEIPTEDSGEVDNTPDADTAEGQDGEQPEADVDLEKSLGVLRRDGLPASVIDKMTNEEILALGAKRSKVQGDVDNTYRELQELKSGKETATESEEDSTVQAEPDERPSYANLNSAIEPFSEIFGEDAGQALGAAMQASVQPVLAQFKAQQDMLEGMLLQSSRQTLSERYPGLSDSEGFDRVSGRMQTLVKSGEYQDIGSLMADAARLEFADQSADANKQLQSKLARDKRGGQAMPSGKAATLSSSLSEEEREDALLDALEGGMDISDAKRMYGQAQPST